MFLELYTSTLRYRLMGEQSEVSFHFWADGHGGGDDYIMKELFDTMQNNTPPKCSGNEGLESAVFAIALDRAAENSAMFDLEPIWKKLNR